jgi:hypothetical protein
VIASLHQMAAIYDELANRAALKEAGAEIT